MIKRDLIVPFRKHTLKECDELICQAGAVDRNRKLWKPKDDAQALHASWIEACLTESKKRLTPWEENFLNSINDQLTLSGSLSDKQIEILERIYTEKT